MENEQLIRIDEAFKGEVLPLQRIHSKFEDAGK